MATKTTTADPNQKILDLMKEVERRKAEIAELGRPNYKTNMSFRYSEDNMNTAINLQTVADVRRLVAIVAFLAVQHQSYKEVGKLLEVESLPTFEWSGFTLEDWTHDIKLRLAKIQIAAKQKKLAALEARLNLIVTPELRRELELKAIEAELS